MKTLTQRLLDAGKYDSGNGTFTFDGTELMGLAAEFERKPMIPAFDPTEDMITAAEMKMPQLGRVQIRFLFETMMAAAPANIQSTEKQK